MLTKFTHKIALIALFVGFVFSTMASAGLYDKLTTAKEQIQATDKLLGKFVDRVTVGSGQAQTLAQMVEMGGNELYLYVVEKLKKQGKTINDVAKEPISSIADGTINDFITSINQYREAVIPILDKWYLELNEIRAGIDNAQASLGEIQATINKRKKAWFKSDKEKDKLAKGEAAMTGLLERLAGMETSLQKYEEIPVEKSTTLNRIFDIKPSDPIEKLIFVGSTDFKATVKNLKRNIDAGVYQARTVKEMRKEGLKDMKVELDLIRQMIDETENKEKGATE